MLEFLYPDAIDDLRTRIRKVCIFVWMTLIITYWIAAAPGAWPLFKNNVILYTMIAAMTATAHQAAVESTANLGPVITAYTLAIVCLAMCLRPILSLSLNLYACAQADDKKVDAINACIATFARTNIPVSSEHVACLKSQGIDVESIGALGTCPFLSGSTGTFYVALMYITSFFVVFICVYIFQLMSKLQEMETGQYSRPTKKQ